MYTEDLMKAVTERGGLFNHKVILSSVLDPENPEDRAMIDALVNPETGEALYVVLREMTSEELTTFYAMPTEERMAGLQADIESYIIDHNFINRKGEKADVSTVVKVIRSSGALLYSVVTDWSSSLPLTRKMLRESAG